MVAPRDQATNPRNKENSTKRIYKKFVNGFRREQEKNGSYQESVHSIFGCKYKQNLAYALLPDCGYPEAGS